MIDYNILAQSILLAPLAISGIILLSIFITSLPELPNLTRRLLMPIKWIKTYEADEVKEILEKNRAKIEGKARTLFHLGTSELTRLVVYDDTSLSLTIKGKSKYDGNKDTQIAGLIQLPTLAKSLSGKLSLAVWVETDDGIWVSDYTAFLKYIEAIIAGKEIL